MQSGAVTISARRFFGGWLILGVFCIALSSFSSTAAASEAAASSGPVDEERLVRRIKAEILRDLREGKWLAEQVELAFARYVEKAKATQDAAAAEQVRKADEKAEAVRRPAAARDHIRGPADAEISLIEYSDFECPYCKTFHQNAAEVLKSSEGKVNWVYRHFLLAFHNPGASKQAEATECARQLGGQRAFWTYTDAIFARTASGGKGFAEEKLVPLAKELGLNPRAFRQCLASARYESRVKEDFEEGQKIGVSATPTTVILNNKTGEVRLVVGTLSVPELKTRIAQLMKNGEDVQQSKGR